MNLAVVLYYHLDHKKSYKGVSGYPPEWPTNSQDQKNKGMNRLLEHCDCNGGLILSFRYVI